MSRIKQEFHAEHSAIRPRSQYGHLAFAVQRHGSAIAMTAWIAVCFAVAFSAIPLPNLACPQDLGVMVEAGYRFYQGLRPHADYHSALGPVLGMVFGIPMVLFGPSYESLRCLPPFLSLIALLWTWLVCRTSMPGWAASLSSMTIACIAGGVYHQGFPPEALTFATVYNRIGFAVLTVVALAALLPRELSPGDNLLKDASIAAGTIVLAFLKANFAVFALPFAVIALILHRRERHEYRRLAAIAAGVSLFFLYHIGFRIDRMIADLMMAATARKQGSGQVFFPLRNLVANHDMLLVMTFPSALISFPRTPRSRDQLLFLLTLIWGPGILGWVITLMQSHGDGSGVPLTICGLAASYAWAIRLRPNSSSGLPDQIDQSVQSANSKACAIALACGCLLFLVPHAYSYYVWNLVARNTGPRQFVSAPIRELFVGGFTNTMGENCVAKINEGTDLVKKHAVASQTLQFVGSSNLFTFACGLRSPRESMLYWDSISTYSDEWHPPPSTLSDTDFVLVPKNTFAMNDDTPQWISIYGYYLAENYRLAEETSFFRLYQRKQRDKQP